MIFVLLSPLIMRNIFILTSNPFHFMHKKTQTNIFCKLAHRWHSLSYFLPQKQDQKFNQRAELGQWELSVCGNSSISSISHWSGVSCREGCNWLMACRGFIASMATLLPYCLGKVKRRERGEATFVQTLPLHYSSFVPECL